MTEHIKPAPAAFDNRVEDRIAETSDYQHLHNLSLVLSAANITHRIESVAPDLLAIHVSQDLTDRAREEIAAYIRENENWPPRPPEPEAQGFTSAFRAMSGSIVGSLAGIYGLSGDWHPKSLWFEKGAGDAEAILNSFEYFRLVTALTLHADAVHLLSNCVLGFFLLHFYLQLTGNGLGLFIMLLTSVAANYLNVLAHGSNHMFVGFSTAVFSIIGLLCTMNASFRKERIVLGVFMPLMAGLALLAMLGSEGERTDLGSHLFGLLCGLLVGSFVRLPGFPSLRDSVFLQIFLGMVSCMAVLGCWLLAFSR